jgi:TolA-binding protein
MRHKLIDVTTLFGLALGVVMIAGSAPAAAQAPVTSADIQRLQDNVNEIGGNIEALRARDARLADSLEPRLEELRDEVTYLKVKLRKQSSVSRPEYVDLLDRLDRLRNDARARPAPSAPEARGSLTEIPVGTEFDVRLQTRLNSGTAKPEDRVDATTLAPYERNGRLLVPAGSVMRGIVSSVTPASRGVDRKGQMTLVFDRFTIDGRTYSIRATVTQALQGQDDNGRIATGAGVGAIIGGILGGLKGALAGILIGGGGTIAATEGNDVDLPPGTVLRVRMDAPLDVGQ